MFRIESVDVISRTVEEASSGKGRLRSAASVSSVVLAFASSSLYRFSSSSVYIAYGPRQFAQVENLPLLARPRQRGRRMAFLFR